MFPKEPIPETLGSYKILRRLPMSGSAHVYLGRVEGPLGFRRVCVLKVLPNTAEGDTRFAEELAREASICAQLNHAAIVKMIDFFEHEDKLVLVLEHVEGATLDRLLQNLQNRHQKLGDAATYYLVHRVAGALAHAHAATDEHGDPAPVIHRNLHPESVIIGWDGQVRLTGFGFGKILGRTPDTVAGIVKGTPGYMAPEQARGERVTIKADVYGVALLLWSLLSGRRPPDDGTRPTSLGTLRPDLARAIVTLIDAALAPLPEERAITCQEIERTLAMVARAETGKAELVRRIQSVHASLEIEEAEPEEERRPTIPVKARTTARIFAGLKRPTQEPPAGEKPTGDPALPEGARKQTVPVPPQVSQLLLAVRGDGHEPSVMELDGDDVKEAPDSEFPVGKPPAVRFGTPPPPHPATTASELSDILFGGPPQPLSPQTPATSTPVEFGPPPALPGAPPVQLGAPPLAPPLSAKEAPAPEAGPRSGPTQRPSLFAPGVRMSTTLRTIAISAITATVVAGISILIVYREPSPTAATAREPAAPPPTGSPPATARPAPSAAPPPTASAAAPPRKDKEIDVAALPVTSGYLLVTFPTSAGVYINGKPLGSTAEPLEVRCGRWYVRLARPGGGRYPEWVSAGLTVNVQCQGITRIDMKPANPPGR